jgi:hypothetical protein
MPVRWLQQGFREVAKSRAHFSRQIAHIVAIDGQARPSQTMQLSSIRTLPIHMMCADSGDPGLCSPSACFVYLASISLCFACLLHATCHSLSMPLLGSVAQHLESKGWAEGEEASAAASRESWTERRTRGLRPRAAYSLIDNVEEEVLSLLQKWPKAKKGIRFWAYFGLRLFLALIRTFLALGHFWP